MIDSKGNQISIGDSVIVNSPELEANFVGYVIAIYEDICTVEDQDFDAFDVTSDEIILYDEDDIYIDADDLFEYDGGEDGD